MEIQTKETTRAKLETVRFGGREWRVVGRHYDTVTLDNGKARIYVHKDLIEPVGVEVTPGVQE